MTDDKIEELQRKLWKAERRRDSYRGKKGMKHLFDHASVMVESLKKELREATTSSEE